LGVSLSTEERELLNNHDHDTENAVKLFSTREEVCRTNEVEFNRLTSRKFSYYTIDNFQWNPNHDHIQSKGFRYPDGTLRALAEHRFDPQVHLKAGMFAVLLVNLNLQEGLVNGSQGVVRGFTPFREGDVDKIIMKARVGDGDPYAHFMENDVREFMGQAPQKQWPVVQFDNDQIILIFCDCTINELEDEKPYSLISRT